MHLLVLMIINTRKCRHKTKFLVKCMSCMLTKQIWRLQKDTWEKCQNSNEGDSQTCSTHTHGRSIRIGLIWYHSLDDNIYYTREKEHQSPYIMNYSHCCFLQSKDKSMPLNIKSTLDYIHKIKMHTTYVDIPGKLQQYTCPNRRTSLTTEQFYWDMVSPHSFPHSASPQTCIWNRWWPLLCKGQNVNLHWTFCDHVT